MSLSTYRESPLHAALKAWYGRPEDNVEQPVDGYIIDLVRGNLLIEIQTGNFAALKPKLLALLPSHALRLVYPVVEQKWIVRETAVGETIGRRKSSQRGLWQDVFRELVHLPPALLTHANLSLELLLTHQEEVWRDDGQGSWRRKGWSRTERRLLGVTAQTTYATHADLLSLLPPNLPDLFTNSQLSQALKCRLRLAQQMTYTLCRCGLLARAGKQGRASCFVIPGG